MIAGCWSQQHVTNERRRQHTIQTADQNSMAMALKPA